MNFDMFLSYMKSVRWNTTKGKQGKQESGYLMQARSELAGRKAREHMIVAKMNAAKVDSAKVREHLTSTCVALASTNVSVAG